MVASAVGGIAEAAPLPSPAGPASPTAGTQQFRLYDGSTVTLGADGLGVRTDARGHKHPFSMVLPQAHSPLGDHPGPSRDALISRLSAPRREGATGDVVLGLPSARLDGAPAGHGRRAAHTTDARVNAALHRVGATTAAPLTMGETYLVHVSQPARAAATLRATPGVSFAEPDQYVSTTDTDAVPLPSWVGKAAAAQHSAAAT